MINVADLPVEMSELDGDELSAVEEFWERMEHDHWDALTTGTVSVGGNNIGTATSIWLNSTSYVPVTSGNIQWETATIPVRSYDWGNAAGDGSTVTGVWLDEVNNGTVNYELSMNALPIIMDPRNFVTVTTTTV